MALTNKITYIELQYSTSVVKTILLVEYYMRFLKELSTIILKKIFGFL